MFISNSSAGSGLSTKAAQGNSNREED